MKMKATEIRKMSAAELENKLGDLKKDLFQLRLPVSYTHLDVYKRQVVQKKTEEKDGYNAVQLGYEDVAEKKLTKPELGHLKKAGEARKRTLKEFKLANCDALNVGDEVKVDVFAEGDRVDVTGISKGHGYQGVIKRHGAARLKESHGTGPVHRHAGSMGSSTDPSRIFKGRCV